MAQRRPTIDVSVGNVVIGSSQPIVVQSMTTTNTLDTEATVAQSIRMIEAGCQLVRITAPSIREAKNLEHIKNELRSRGYQAPLVADIHFTPNAVEVAARIVEKVRVNPGNYADKKNFTVLEYTNETYDAEIERIRTRFVPLVRICKEYGTAMRIGTNHGSLSDRILSRYGDNPHGMVESALEFLRIAEDEGYYNIVLSMKSSNPIVMIEAYRLLAKRLTEEQLQPYPLHLGVTEAGDGEDGRIKSAIGIGTLLVEGLGDTVRVSLTEEPEAEMPAARAIIEATSSTYRSTLELSYTHVASSVDTALPVAMIGGTHVPRIVMDCSSVTIEQPSDLAVYGHSYNPVHDKWSMKDQAAEFIYAGSTPLPFMPPNGIRVWLDDQVWQTVDDRLFNVPVFSIESYRMAASRHTVMNVVKIKPGHAEHLPLMITLDKTVVLLLDTNGLLEPHREIEEAVSTLRAFGCQAPVVYAIDTVSLPSAQLHTDLGISSAAVQVGGAFVDGFGSGIMMSALPEYHAEAMRLAFGILQATRKRMTKTEYISCPSCGRTLFDLQETTSTIRSRTDHLKGLKIGIMGCIVNGPGEMADADYGYVGSGPEKITLYRGQNIVKRNVPASDALDELIAIMKDDGVWFEPQHHESIP